VGKNRDGEGFRYPETPIRHLLVPSLNINRKCWSHMCIPILQLSPTLILVRCHGFHEPVFRNHPTYMLYYFQHGFFNCSFGRLPWPTCYTGEPNCPMLLVAVYQLSNWLEVWVFLPSVINGIDSPRTKLQGIRYFTNSGIMYSYPWCRLQVIWSDSSADLAAGAWEVQGTSDFNTKTRSKSRTDCLVRDEILHWK